jgi:NAD+ kinase
MTINKVGILYHPRVEATHTKAEEVARFIRGKGIAAWLCSSWELEPARVNLPDTDLLLSCGGDGTILRTAQAALARQIPIAGINMGTLGFLTEISAGEALDKLPALLAGEGWVEERAMLRVELLSNGQEESPHPEYFALNDVVVARGAIARLITVDVAIDGEHFTNYRADGVIVATATGSTGYALAAGGPVLHPQSADILLVPVVGHFSLPFSMVLPDTSEVQLRVATTHQATLSVDGHINLPVFNGALVSVGPCPHKTRFLRICPQGYFYSSLEKKLKRKE